MPRVIAVATQKGGVGKTTTATNLAAAIVGQYVLRVLVLDLDPQCDTTALLLGHTAETAVTIRDVLWEPRAAGEVMIASPMHPDLFVVPGSGELSDDEKQVSANQWNEIAQDARQTLIGGVPSDIDVVVIDTPPSLGLWLHCALAAADGYILMGEAAALSARGMGAFLKTARKVRENLNPDLHRLGLVINNVRPTAEDEGFVQMYLKKFKNEVLAVIPQRTAVKEASRFAIPVEFFSAAPPDARRSYREIAAAVLDQLGVPTPPRAIARGRRTRPVTSAPGPAPSRDTPQSPDVSTAAGSATEGQGSATLLDAASQPAVASTPGRGLKRRHLETVVRHNDLDTPVTMTPAEATVDE